MVCDLCGLPIFGGKGDYWHVDSIYDHGHLHLAYPKEENMSENNEQNPKVPLSALVEAAISMHDLYMSFVAAGFTESQALFLVSQSLRPQTPNN